MFFSSQHPLLLVVQFNVQLSGGRAEAFLLDLPGNVRSIRISFGVSIANENDSITMYLNNIMLYGTLSITDPMTEPTTLPTVEPTQSTSISPTSPTAFPSEFPEATQTQFTSPPIISHRLYGYLVLGSLVLSSLIIVISCIDARCIRGRINDFYSASALISAAFQILDFISDLFFCAEMLSLSRRFIHLAIASAAFIMIPSILSLAQLYHAVQRWRSIGNDMLTAWLFNHAFGLYVFSLLTGNAFSGVQICRSDMFGLSQFAMPLNHNQIIEFQSKKLWSTVMLEVGCFVHFAICFRNYHRNHW